MSLNEHRKVHFSLDLTPERRAIRIAEGHELLTGSGVYYSTACCEIEGAHPSEHASTFPEYVNCPDCMEKEVFRTSLLEVEIAYDGKSVAWAEGVRIRRKTGQP